MCRVLYSMDNHFSVRLFQPKNRRNFYKNELHIFNRRLVHALSFNRLDRLFLQGLFVFHTHLRYVTDLFHDHYNGFIRHENRIHHLILDFHFQSACYLIQHFRPRTYYLFKFIFR